MGLLKDLMTKHWFPVFLTKTKFSRIKIPGWRLLYLTGSVALMRNKDGTKKWVRFKEIGTLMLTEESYEKWASKNGYNCECSESEIILTPSE